MSKIPKFKSLEEAARFWDTHDFEDYVSDTEPVTITIRTPRRKKTLTVPIELGVYERIAATCRQAEGIGGQDGVGVA